MNEISEKALLRIITLWQNVFGDNEEYIRSFYRSFDTAGNVIGAFKKTNGTLITSDINTEGEMIGLVNRVPVKLLIDRKTINGHYIYAGCVHPSYRGQGIYGELMREAEKNTIFTALIPANDLLFGMYRKMGYTETAGTPFPYTIDRMRLGRFETEPYDGNVESLYEFYLFDRSDRFIQDFPFFLFTLSGFIADGYIYYLKDKNGKRCGYIVYSENNKTIKVYDIYCPPYKYFDIMESDMSAAENIKYKGMIRPIAGAPALNMFGEY